MTYHPTQPGDHAAALSAAWRRRELAVADWRGMYALARQRRPDLPRLDAYRAARWTAGAADRLRRAAAVYRVTRAAYMEDHRRARLALAQNTAAPYYQTTGDTAERR